MQLIYTHANPMIVENIKNLLENAGIKVQVKNQFALGAVGELAPINAWPEIWLERNGDMERAKKLVASLNTDCEEAEWVCEKCGEKNGGSFEVCWKCCDEYQEQPES